MKKRVALIFGGEGYEHGISKLSAENLFGFIDKDKYAVLRIKIEKDGAWYTAPPYPEEYPELVGKGRLAAFPVKIGNESGFLIDGRLIPVCTAIPCLHGNLGEDGIIQGALRAAHINYIGEDVYASAATSDKVYSKLMAESLGIPTARWLLTSDTDKDKAIKPAEEKLGYPMFIKPARAGSSYGAHPVYEKAEFGDAFNDALRYDSRILIEELIPICYELECALFNDGQSRCIAPSGRVLSDGKFYDFEAKYRGVSAPRAEAAAAKNPEIEEKIASYTNSLADLIGIHDLGRFDFFVTRDNEIYFNEINAIPGMTKNSLYPKLTETMGMGRGEFINLLIEKKCDNDRRI